MAKKKHTLHGWARWLRATMFGSGRYEYGVITFLAAIIGVIAGYAAIGFYLAIEAIIIFAFGESEATFATGITNLPWWQILLVPIIGGLVVGQILRFLPNNLTKGVPHVIEAAALKKSHVDLKEGLISAAATILSLGAGASSGREGPVVHLGATLAAFVTDRLHLNPATARTLLGCAVASAVAASFNAPIAGVFFALEVIIGHYALHTFAPIVIAAIAGTLVSRAHLGDNPAFQVIDYSIVSFWEFPAFFILGIVAAIVAIIFMTAINYGDKIRTSFSKIPYWLHPAIAGLILGMIALVYPEVLSVGYEATSKALNGEYTLQVLLALIVAKIFAATVSLAGRFGGGVFSPSLFIGAVLGGAFGLIVATIFPELASSHGMYAIVGMGAMASAVLGAPISTMLIVFEITGDYSTTIAVMIASAVASLVSNLFYRRSIFHMQLANRGIFLEGGRATYLLKSAHVSDHMTRDFYTLQTSEKAIKARELLMLQGGGILIVTNETGHMEGILSFSELPSHVFEGDMANSVTVGELLRRAPTVVKSSDILEVALNKLEMSGEETLPVVSPEGNNTVVGLIKHRMVMREYNRALLESHGQDKTIGKHG
ncbi:chloride channel protein [Kordiimonas sp. SCSIO 12610]|uniref:chloride channel protein n=1 Tax=Kordiimonas sp. SCSIO 12610 TaxID=2829597 RepID=UPI00210D9F0B|nr:chloride channel protein [Kordiimonas sp. SCSIO 12610]UTW54439.1 chloride channel protein [Kordiimonas sp. SCSIO 12610]